MIKMTIICSANAESVFGSFPRELRWSWALAAVLATECTVKRAREDQPTLRPRRSTTSKEYGKYGVFQKMNRARGGIDFYTTPITSAQPSSVLRSKSVAIMCSYRGLIDHSAAIDANLNWFYDGRYRPNQN
jgi:hypothetical protein